MTTTEIWRTVNVPTHPQKDGRWVASLARIRDNKTGEVREYAMKEILADGEDQPCDYIWTDGNYGCDCNRALFFAYATGLEYEDVDHPCGEGAYSVQLVNPETGRVWYDEFQT